MPVLTFDHVVKRFGDFAAVDALSFSVSEGGIFGFLGSNGAGKTTSLRMALDILRPSAGRIEILGRAPGRENAALIGFLPEERGLYRQMTVLDTVVYFGRLKGMAAPEAQRAAATLIEQFGLGAWRAATVEKLSKGLAQKVQLATALVNSPKLLLLDEPFSGLDPVNQSVLEAIVLDMARGGATVIFSTHVMQHAERLCDRLLLLARGRKIFEGTQDEARRCVPGRLTLTAKADPGGLPQIVSAKPIGVNSNGWRDWEVALAPGADPGDLLQACTAQAFALRRFDFNQPSLHDVFIHLVGSDQEAKP